MDIERLDSLEVIRNREGILYVGGEPLYIFVHKMYAGTGGVDYVACYEVDKPLYEKSKGTVIDKTKTLVKTKQYSDGSVLGRIGNKMLSDKGRKDIYTYKPAIYVATIEQGTSFISGKEGVGFKEYTPDRINIIDGKLERGEPTGVFILLEDIYWGESVVDLEALSQSLTRDGGDWHDL